MVVVIVRLENWTFDPIYSHSSDTPTHNRNDKYGSYRGIRSVTPTQMVKQTIRSYPPDAGIESKGVRRAVILAAGRGSRLHALTDDAPK